MIRSSQRHPHQRHQREVVEKWWIVEILVQEGYISQVLKYEKSDEVSSNAEVLNNSYRFVGRQ